MKIKLKKALKEIDSNLYRRIDYSSDVGEYLLGALKVFKKYDQGSLSFTVTKLKHVGYDYPYSILEACESALKDNRNNADSYAIA